MKGDMWTQTDTQGDRRPWDHRGRGHVTGSAEDCSHQELEVAGRMVPTASGSGPPLRRLGFSLSGCERRTCRLKPLKCVICYGRPGKLVHFVQNNCDFSPQALDSDFLTIFPVSLSENWPPFCKEKGERAVGLAINDVWRPARKTGVHFLA